MCCIHLSDQWLLICWHWILFASSIQRSVATGIWSTDSWELQQNHSGVLPAATLAGCKKGENFLIAPLIQCPRVVGQVCWRALHSFLEKWRQRSLRLQIVIAEELYLGVAETAICIGIGAASNMLVPEYMEYILMGTVMIVPGCNQKFKARSGSYTDLSWLWRTKISVLLFQILQV